MPITRGYVGTFKIDLLMDDFSDAFPEFFPLLVPELKARPGAKIALAKIGEAPLGCWIELPDNTPINKLNQIDSFVAKHDSSGMSKNDKAVLAQAAKAAKIMDKLQALGLTPDEAAVITNK